MRWQTYRECLKMTWWMPPHWVSTRTLHQCIFHQNTTELAIKWQRGCHLRYKWDPLELHLRNPGEPSDKRCRLTTPHYLIGNLQEHCHYTWKTASTQPPQRLPQWTLPACTDNRGKQQTSSRDLDLKMNTGKNIHIESSRCKQNWGRFFAEQTRVLYLYHSQFLWSFQSFRRSKSEFPE